jgi:tetratricopeptide (TPR) repeat protein
MAALIAALERDPARRWRLAGLSALALGGVAALSMGVAQRGDRPCRAAAGILAEVWNPERQATVEREILATQTSYATQTWERVGPRLDRYAEAWVATHTDACEAASIRRDQSPEVLDRRMACLHAAKISLAATVEVLETADAEVVRGAVELVQGLPPLHACSDVARLEQNSREPTDPEVRREVTAIREEMAQAESLRRAGRLVEGLRGLTELEPRVREVDHPPLVASFDIQQARALASLDRWEEGEVAVRRALSIALAHRMPELATRAANRLLWIATYGRRDGRGVRGLETIALPLARRVGPDALEEARTLDFLGMSAEVRGEYEEAAALHERALAIAERVASPDDPVIVSTLWNAAGAYRSLSRYDDAERALRRSMEIETQSLGPMHPRVGESLSNLAVILADQAKYEESDELGQRALEVLTAAYGPDHARPAMVKINLGKLRNAQERPAEAEALYREALATLETTRGPDHRWVANVRRNLATALKEQGKVEEAEALYLDALADLRASAGDEHPFVVGLLDAMGRFYLDQHRYGDADERVGQAIALGERILPADHQLLGWAHHTRGRLAEALGDHAQALEHHGRAMQIFEHGAGPPLDFAEPAFAVARLTVDGRDRAGAIALAERAADHIARDPSATDLRAEIDAWLQRRR